MSAIRKEIQRYRRKEGKKEGKKERRKEKFTKHEQT